MVDLRRAPQGQFRVIGRDSSSDTGWMKGDYPDLEEAKKVTEKTSFVRFKIYNDTGECVHSSER